MKKTAYKQWSSTNESVIERNAIESWKYIMIIIIHIKFNEILTVNNLRQLDTQLKKWTKSSAKDELNVWYLKQFD